MARKRNKYERNRRPKRVANNVILIVCCGDTEKKYFRKFNIDLGEIRIKAVTQAENPTSIIEYAMKLRKMEMYRQVWCVFDKDQFEDFDEAILLGKRENIKVAFSNQAFEYWFILHYERANRPIDRRQYGDILEKYMSRPYKKLELDMYTLLKDKMDFAIENAKVIHQMHNKNGGLPSTWESCTTVYQLVEELLKWKK